MQILSGSRVGQTDPVIVAAADGSSLSNPGPAGWAWYVDDGRWGAGGWPRGTNNMGELMAVLDLLLQTAPGGDALHVLCDSQYVINACTKWMPGWKRKGWRKADGKPVQNVELLKQLDAELAGRVVTFEWVKGHSGHELNEAADVRARAAATAFQQNVEPDAGPGFGDGEASPAIIEVETYWPEQDGLFGVDEGAVSDAERVIALERSLLTEEVRSDPAAMAVALHPDFVEHGSSARIWTKQDVLAELAVIDGPAELEVLGVETLAEGVMLLRWRCRTGESESLRSSIWQCNGSVWRLRFQQGTRG